ncbi:MAG: alginate lyase family protein [Rhodobacteraceae bacterium]|nr:alginate lyase family protein [Paracoccaceae bacterium]
MKMRLFSLMAPLALTATRGAPQGASAAGLFVCAPAPEPVASLAYGSRYTDESVTRSHIDEDSNAEVDEALGPIDDFLRDLSDTANMVFDPKADRLAAADCAVAQMAAWARAGAMTDLQSRNANMTIASRLAAFGLIADQVNRFSSDRYAQQEVGQWLNGLMQRQMVWWEEEAPPGAKQGNLRAWAALAGAAVAEISDDPLLRAWSAWSAKYVMCKASDDGSLPQEMSRGKFSYHYQLHATAPLVVTAALLERHRMPMRQECDNALDRIVQFSLSDWTTGQRTAAITGVTQNYFDGTKTLKGFNLAWIEAYLSMAPSARMSALAEPYRPLGHSKLGGNQTLIWGSN